MKKIRVHYIFIGLGIYLGVALIISIYPIPVQILTEYPFHGLLEESRKMHECAECHDGNDFHSCETCHNDHGSVTLKGIDFYSTLHITGDVPREMYLPLNKTFIMEERKNEKINIFDLLQENNINNFDKVIIYTNDGGFVTIAIDNLGDDSYLVPYEDGIRFIDEDLHESTWLKSIVKIIIISSDGKFQVNGMPITYGELLFEEAVEFTVERAKVMYKNSNNGRLKSAETATRIEGVQLTSFLSPEGDQDIEVITNENVLVFKKKELLNLKITLIDDQVVVVFPNLSRKDWIYGVKEIRGK
jgi:hypothetical protein